MIPEDPEMTHEEALKENRQLRLMLAGALGGPHLYRDDGELSCSAEFPAIDFRRDTATLIQNKIIERNRKRLSRFRSLEDAIRSLDETSRKWSYILESDKMDSTRPLYKDPGHSISFYLLAQDKKTGEELYRRDITVVASSSDHRFKIGNDWVDITQKTAIALWARGELFADITNKERTVPLELERIRDSVDLKSLHISFNFQ